MLMDYDFIQIIAIPERGFDYLNYLRRLVLFVESDRFDQREFELADCEGSA